MCDRQCIGTYDLLSTTLTFFLFPPSVRPLAGLVGLTASQSCDRRCKENEVPGNGGFLIRGDVSALLRLNLDHPSVSDKDKG
jgi:hypothetical protein